MPTAQPPRIVSEAEALRIGGDLGFAVLDACAVAHAANGTSPRTSTLSALVTFADDGRPTVARVAALPLDEAAAIAASGAAPALTSIVQPVAAPPSSLDIRESGTITLPRTSVAGVLVALRSAAPDSPALRSMPDAATVLGAYLGALLRAALAVVEATPPSPVRAELVRALAPFGVHPTTDTP